MAQRAEYRFSPIPENRVAHGMAMLVVEALEMVQVDHDDGQAEAYLQGRYDAPSISIMSITAHCGAKPPEQ